MTEAEFIAGFEPILNTHLDGFKIEIIDRKKESINEMYVKAAVIFKDGGVSTGLITDLIKHQANSADEVELLETKKQLDNLDFEVVILGTTIKYISE